MKEIVLRHFFEGYATAAELDADVPGTEVREGPKGGPYVIRYRVQRMDREFEVRSEHLIQLLDAAATGELQLDHLRVICSWMEGGMDTFLRNADTPDGERVAEALFWLGTPEINYPLTPTVLAKIRQFLATGENLLTAADTKVRQH